MRANRVPYRHLLVTATVLAVTLVGAGCTGEDGGQTGPEADPTQSLLEPSEAPTLSVEPVTSSGELVGKLPRKKRREVERSVSGVVVRWLDSAFLGGRYPRRHFRNAFAVFTPAARSEAREDLGLLTNARVGTRVSGVTPTRVGVRVDLLAVGGRAVTATGHVDVRFRTRGRLQRTFRIDGRLMMTRQEGRWRVFAYDVGRVRVDGGAGRTKRDRDGRQARQRGQQGKKQDKDRTEGGRS